MSADRSAAENPRPAVGAEAAAGPAAGSAPPAAAGTTPPLGPGSTPPPAPGSSSRRPRGAVREGLIAAGLELARTGGPDAVVLREATRIVGVVPNAAYRHFADRDELLAAVCQAAMGELGARMKAGVDLVPGEYGDPDAAFGRMAAVGIAYLEFAREEPGLFATAYAVPDQHTYFATDPTASPAESPLGRLRVALDELVEAGLLDAGRREGIEFPVWSAVHGLAVLIGQGPLRVVSEEDIRMLRDRVLGFIAEGLLLPGGAG